MPIPRDKQFWYAVAVLIGTMVGVGVFGIPFVFAKAGFWIGLSFLAGIALLTIVSDLMYGEVTLRTDSLHQLVGYARNYVGFFWSRIVFFAEVLSIYGALLAYVIIAGEFLNNLFGHFFFTSQARLSTMFFVVLSLSLLAGLRRIAWLELGLAALFTIVIFLIFGTGIPHINLENFKTINFESWFLPYGVLLFAFSGFSAIPLQRRILEGRERELKKAIYFAVGIVAVLYTIFAFSVLGVTGDTTSPNAISGLLDVLGPQILFLGSLFGILAVSTSYLALGSALIDVFVLDFRISKAVSWFLVVLPPYILFLSGLRNFIDIIGVSGAVASGLIYIALVITYAHAKHRGDRLPEFSLHIPRGVLYLIIFVALAGILYTLFV